MSAERTHQCPRRLHRGRHLAVLPALITLFACGSQKPVTEVATATVERMTIERIVVATGTIEPEREVKVRPRIAGIIQKIFVEAGDEVVENQILMEIERDLLESQVREASAALDEARVERRFAGIEVNRLDELKRSGAASTQKHDSARSRHERAGARVARARARLDTLETQLGYASVRSPLVGRVLEVHTEEGSAVSPVTAVTGGTLLLSLAGTDILHLEGLVDENEVARIELGQQARIRTEAFQDEIFEGTVREIAPMGQRIQNVTYFEIKIEIAGENTRLRPRMSGDGEIITEIIPDALTIPETALHYRGDQIFVQMSETNGTGEPVERDIQIGIVDGDRVQILDGLEEGDVIRLQ